MSTIPEADAADLTTALLRDYELSRIGAQLAKRYPDLPFTLKTLENHRRGLRGKANGCLCRPS